MKFSNEVFLQTEYSREVLNLINYLDALMGMDLLINLTWFRTNKRRVEKTGVCRPAGRLLTAVRIYLARFGLPRIDREEGEYKAGEKCFES